MTMHNRTYTKNKNETYQRNELPLGKCKPQIFKKADFEDKRIVLVLAKTWGAARLFFFKTALCKFLNVRVEYLSKTNQLRGLNRQDVIVIQLPRALETDRNVTCLKMAKERNIKVLDFEIPDGA